MCLLYFLQGVPQGLIYFALLDWLAGNGFTIKDIAIITAIASIPWSLKFLIGPFVDYFSNSLMGKRRPWIIISTLMMSETLIFAAFLTSQNIDPLILGITLFSTILATSILDVATDGMAIDILNENERGFVNGLMWAFRTLGVSISAIFSSIIINNYGLGEAMFYLGLAIALIGILNGEYDFAQKHLDVALDLDPDYVLAYENLVYLSQLLGDNNSAKLYLQKIIEIM